jgi:hypothetical protein
VVARFTGIFMDLIGEVKIQKRLDCDSDSLGQARIL